MCGTSWRWWGADGLVADVGHEADLLGVDGLLQCLVALLKFEQIVLSVVGSLRVPAQPVLKVLESFVVCDALLVRTCE